MQRAWQGPFVRSFVLVVRAADEGDKGGRDRDGRGGGRDGRDAKMDGADVGPGVVARLTEPLTPGPGDMTADCRSCGRGGFMGPHGRRERVCVAWIERDRDREGERGRESEADEKWEKGRPVDSQKIRVMMRVWAGDVKVVVEWVYCPAWPAASTGTQEDEPETKWSSVGWLPEPRVN